MRRMDSAWSARVAGCGALLAAMALMVMAPLTATAASFDSSNYGFDPNSAGVGDLGTTAISLDPLYSVGDLAELPGVDFDIEITGSANMCILAPNDNVCQVDPSAITGPYSGIVSWTVSAVNNEEIDGPFLLMLTQLTSDYAANEVIIDLDATVPANLDTSAVEPGFVFDGTFAEPLNVVDETFAFAGDEFIYNYLGWVVELGDTVSFKFDVTTDENGRGTPQFRGNGAPVPEPGTALLMGLGLAGLAFGGGRRE